MRPGCRQAPGEDPGMSLPWRPSPRSPAGSAGLPEQGGFRLSFLGTLRVPGPVPLITIIYLARLITSVRSILVDAVMDRWKIILAVWVVATLVLVPPAVKMLEQTGGSIESLADRDSESARASEVIWAYFDDPCVDESRIPLLVVEYHVRDGYRQLMGDEEIGLPAYSDYIQSRFVESKDWILKLDLDRGGVAVLAEDMGTSSGAMVLGMLYSGEYSGYDLMDDTWALRDAVASFTSDYMHKLHEPEAFFSVYVTGNPALADDLNYELSDTFLSAVILAFALTLILTGLFFGSGVSTFIMFASIVSPVIATMATMFGVSSMTSVFVVSAILVLISTMVISFVNCLYVISLYRRELAKFGDADRAMKSTVEWSFAPIASTSVCLFICAVTLSIVGNGEFESIGACLAFSSMITLVSSLTIPASLIRLTRKELFWTAGAGSRRMPKAIGRACSRIGNAFRRFVAGTSRATSRHGMAVIAVAACLAVCCAGYLADQERYEDEFPYDMADSLATGDSRMGLEVMESYGLGGILNPYRVVLGYGHLLGTMSWDGSMAMLEWNDVASVAEASALAEALAASDPDNIASVTSVVTWQDLLDKAGYSAGDDSEEALSKVRSVVEGIHPTLAGEYDRTIDELVAAGSTSQDILDSGGPYMDYALNTALGTVGYEMLSDKSVAVTHLMVRVATKESSVSGRSLETTEKISSVVNDFREGSAADEVLIAGTGMVYSEFLGSAESGIIKSVPPVLLMLFIVMSILSSAGTAARGVVTTVLSGLISLCLASILMAMIWGGVSMAVQAFMISVCFFMGTWFNAVQENRMAHCRKEGMDRREASSAMLLELQPVLVVAALVLSGCFAAFCFSDNQMLSQLGFAVVLCILVDIFFVRTFVSPAIWSLKWRGKA